MPLGVEQITGRKVLRNGREDRARTLKRSRYFVLFSLLWIFLSRESKALGTQKYKVRLKEREC